MTITVEVRGNNVEKALRVLKKKLQKDGIMKELRERKHFEKPSLKRARKKIKRTKRLTELLDMNKLPISNDVINMATRKLEGVYILWLQKS